MIEVAETAKLRGCCMLEFGWITNINEHNMYTKICVGGCILVTTALTK